MYTREGTYEQQREITKPPNMNKNSMFSQNCGLPMAIHLSNASKNLVRITIEK
jgi:hypothetical protein